jgi:hypothetical protein
MQFKDFQLTDEFIRKVIEEIETPQNLSRKRRAWISRRVREGGLYDYVQDVVKKMYPKTWEMYSISEYSILKKVINKLAKSYKKSPKRRVVGADGQPKPEVMDKLGPVLKVFNFNQAMKDFDRTYVEHKYSLLACLMDLVGQPAQPFWRFFALEPYEYDLAFDGKGQARLCVLSYPSASVRSNPRTAESDMINSIIAESGGADEGIDRRYYAFWTASQYVEVDVSGPLAGAKRKDGPNSTKIEIIETRPDRSNPYGIFPFVYAPMTSEVNYPDASPLPSQTVQLNALLSVYFTSANMQVGMLAVKFPADQKVTIESASMYTQMSLPQSTKEGAPETSAEFVSPSPDLGGHRQAIMTYARMILDEQGIGSTGVVDGDGDKFASGLDRLISMADVQEVIEENQELYGRVEAQAFQIISQQAKIANAPMGDGVLDVVYQKPKVMVSDSEILDNLKKMKELGIFTDAQILQAYDPNLSETEAEGELQKIANAKSEAIAALGTDPSTVFNGAQVASIVETARAVGAGEIEAEAAANILSTSFGIPLERARLLIPSGMLKTAETTQAGGA